MVPDQAKCRMFAIILGYVQQLVEFLKKNQDVFSWIRVDMVGIHPDVMCHQLNIDPHARPVLQKLRALDADRYKVLQEKIDHILRLEFIKESYNPDQLSNIVLVPKSNGKWRTCIDFTKLNKACLKDSFPLPQIDQLVDAIVGYELISFMDADSGYNQILMLELDEDHTFFIIDCVLYYYKACCLALRMQELLTRDW